MPLSIGMLIFLLIAGGAIGYGFVRGVNSRGNWLLFGIGSFFFAYLIVEISQDRSNYAYSAFMLVSLVTFIVLLIISPRSDWIAMFESIFWTSVEVLHEKIGLLYFYIGIGYVFIRCRSIGYGYASVIVLWLLLLAYMVGDVTFLQLSETEKFLAILFGTLVGGWHFLQRHTHGFGFPFFRMPNYLERLELYFDKRRARRAYAEELGRAEARKQAGTSNGSQQNSGSQRRQKKQSDRSSSQRKQKEQTSQKSQNSKERFQNARQKKPARSSNTETDWDILEIPRGSSKDVIKQAYRKQANRFHPDKMPDSIRGDADLEDAYNAKFIKVKKAYERLNR